MPRMCFHLIGCTLTAAAQETNKREGNWRQIPRSTNKIINMICYFFRTVLSTRAGKATDWGNWMTEEEHSPPENAKTRSNSEENDRTISHDHSSISDVILIDPFPGHTTNYCCNTSATRKASIWSAINEIMQKLCRSWIWSLDRAACKSLAILRSLAIPFCGWWWGGGIVARIKFYSPDVAIRGVTWAAVVVVVVELPKDMEIAPFSSSSEISDGGGVESKIGESRRPVPTKELSSQHFLEEEKKQSRLWLKELQIPILGLLCRKIAFVSARSFPTNRPPRCPAIHHLTTTEVQVSKLAAFVCQRRGK